MIVYALLALALAFVAGCLLGQASALTGWRYLRARGWRLWYLGRLYEIPPEGQPDLPTVGRAHARARAARGEKSRGPQPPAPLS